MAFALIYGVSIMMIAGSSPTALMAPLFFLVILFLGISILVYRTVEYHFRLAVTFWLSALGAMVVAVGGIMRQPEIFFFAIPIPLAAVFTINMPCAILTVIGMVLLALWSVRGGMPASYATLVPVLGAVVGILAWVASRGGFSLAVWSYENYHHASRELEEARTRQLEFAQTQEDLVQAYQNLARLTERLKILQGAAEESRRAKAEFVANVSHELRTLLT